LPVVLTVALLLAQIVVFKGDPHIPILLGVVFTALMGLSIGFRWADLEEGILNGIRIGLASMIILMTVGMLIGTWILSGTVPAMIYLGLQTLSPAIFLVASMVICSVVSLATGTSWGTVGTVGLALIGIGEGLGMPLPLVAGSVISGAFFGDKMSPLSDTTNLAPAVAGAGLFPHIRHMATTTVPAMLIAGVLYAFLGLRYAGNALDSSGIMTITTQLENTFWLSPWLLAPAVLVMALAMLRVPAIPALFMGVVAGGVLAMVTQGASLREVFVAMQAGYVSETGIAAVDSLLSRGGLNGMMWTVSLIFLALSFGGILERTRALETILESILRVARGRGGLISSTVLTAIGVNAIAGDPYLSIALPGRMYAPAYTKEGLTGRNLSRAIEDGGTMVSPLIPWNSGGAYCATMLGVATFAYLPFAFANWLTPLISIIYGLTGLFVEQVQPEDAEGRPVPAVDFT
jgi:NhaC family Na+:H+ antiporter